MKLGHLTRRFIGSLSSADPSPADSAWARSFLLPGEQALWRRMPAADRRHSIGVARRTAALLGGHTGGAGPTAAPGPSAGPEVDRAVMAAALLHDVGKIEAGLGTFGRVGATVVGAAVGRARAAGWPGPVGRYLSHAERGAFLLASAGSDPLTVAWAREHHLPAARWTVPPAVGEALKAADDD
jgi:hypothetical protein